MTDKFLHIENKSSSNGKTNHLIPDKHDSYTLGTVNKRWKEIHCKEGFFDDQTLHLGNRWKITVDDTDESNSAIKIKHSHHGHDNELEHENDRDITIGNVDGSHGIDESKVREIVIEEVQDLTLNGVQGPTGATGATGATGPAGSDGLMGMDGLSAYEVATNSENFVGSEVEWLASLKGETGSSIHQIPLKNGLIIAHRGYSVAHPQQV